MRSGRSIGAPEARHFRHRRSWPRTLRMLKQQPHPITQFLDFLCTRPVESLQRNRDALVEHFHEFADAEGFEAEAHHASIPAWAPGVARAVRASGRPLVRQLVAITREDRSPLAASF